MISAEELYKLFCGMTETMQTAIIEIMKVTQEKESEIENEQKNNNA